MDVEDRIAHLLNLGSLLVEDERTISRPGFLIPVGTRLKPLNMTLGELQKRCHVIMRTNFALLWNRTTVIIQLAPVTVLTMAQQL